MINSTQATSNTLFTRQAVSKGTITNHYYLVSIAYIKGVNYTKI